MNKIEKRLVELERRIKELEAAPREQHTHWHTYPPAYVPDWTRRPYQPYTPWWGTVRKPQGNIQTTYTLPNANNTLST